MAGRSLRLVGITAATFVAILTAAVAAAPSPAPQQNRWPPTPPITGTVTAKPPATSASPASPTSPAAPASPASPASPSSPAAQAAAAQPGATSDAPDLGALASVYPELRRMAAPTWVAQGTRLSYYAASATVGGGAYRYELDPTCNTTGKGDPACGWVDQQGNRYRQSSTGDGSSGEGIVQVNVTRLTPTTAVLDTRSLLLTSGTARFRTHLAAVTPAGAGLEYWVNPAFLAGLKEVNSANVRVLRGPFTLSGQRYNALWIYLANGAGHTAYVYDLASGVLLMTGGASGGAAPTVIGPGSGSASTMLTEMYLVNARTVNLPWNNGNAPAWVARTPSLRYDGGLSVAVPGSYGLTPLPTSYMYRLTSQGSNWSRYSASTVTSMRGAMGAGMPAMPDSFGFVSGPAQVGGLWIAPEALATLRPGQLLDRDPVTGMTTQVGSIGAGARGSAGVVTIVEGNGAQRTEYAYDRSAGILVGMRMTEAVGPSQMQVQVQLSR